ncbi:M14 family metallopeptidase [Paraflavitalea pollutisoli]|uniref:M14 family metallopeptidase n=1 Tax=Paraflavitalea pollutisoli TaxID=3034143 RepID=UPI0023EB09A8|nr:M14 family metallopeptidase [Paraflavitalea sp. H1-2-19X]
MPKIIAVALLLLVLQSTNAQSLPQNAARLVQTYNRPIQQQWKGVFSFPGGDVWFSNNFPGARVSGVARVNDSLYTLLITSENTPVNASPWYAFKVWSKRPQQIVIKLTYQQGVNHRYAPWISKNGQDWSLLTQESERDSATPDYSFHLRVGADTTWVAAQELSTSADVQRWANQVSKKAGVPVTVIGKSQWGKPINALKWGNQQSCSRILLMSRQHSPEVTGQIAQKAFVERLLENDALAKQFRQRFLVYLLPMLNPDGVDEGTWRHSAGGVDLNRDWYAFNQPETKAVQQYLQRELANTDNKLLFALDFHSTQEEIFFIVDPKQKSLLPGFSQTWIQATQQQVTDLKPVIRPLVSEGPSYTSLSYLFQTYGTETIVHELSDNSPREWLIRKSKASAVAMMQLLLNQVPE